MNWSDVSSVINKSVHGLFGTSIQYVGNLGQTAPVALTCYLRPSQGPQSGTPGYWADIEIDPKDQGLTAAGIVPQRKDLVIWPDGTTYFVNRPIVLPESGMLLLSLHTRDK